MQQSIGISLKKLRKQFGAFVAVNDLDLEVGAGEFVSLLGPSGCGKTTTLRMLAGLDFPTSGTISFGDQVVNDLTPARRNIAMVFQSYALYPHMTVRENIAYPLKKRGVPKAELPARVAAVARLLQLEPYMSRRPKELSGGQQQRVALGSALVREPDFFLLDEPLSNLDAKLRAHMRTELIELHRKIGKTMIYVTHDQLEAMTMSSRIAVMRGGNLQQFDTPAEIYQRPANVFVADFIGTPSMTLLDADLHRRNGSAEVRIGGTTIALPDRHVAPARANIAPIKLGIRPEDVVLDEVGFPAEVKVVEPTGHECIVLFALHGTTVKARVPAHVRLDMGQSAKISFRISKLHIFDRATGLRMS